MQTRLATTIGLITATILATLAFGATPSSAQVEDTVYTAVTPCAVFDSRTTQGATGVFAGPYLGDRTPTGFAGVNNKTLQITDTFPTGQGGGNTDCGIPKDAVAVHINIVATNPLTAGNIVAAPAGQTPPTGGIVNYQVLTPALNNSNASNIPLSADGTLDIYTNCGQSCTAATVDVRGVVLGYYTPGNISDLEARIEALETLLTDVTRDNAGPNETDRLLFTGMNLQIVDGTGNTECTHANSFSPDLFEDCNGLGNLIIGYNEDPESAESRTGVHSLILGTDNDWTAFSNVTVGRGNAALQSYSTVTGGQLNTSSGLYSSVTGGNQNTASNFAASVSGGRENVASGLNSSVTGGTQGAAEGQVASVTGGQNNTASGNFASVTGGQDNTASQLRASVTGGQDNTASGVSSSVTGGNENTAIATDSSISGGQNNLASGLYSSISGGHDNTTSGFGWSSITGGFGNSASGNASTVSGGVDNVAEGRWSSVTGGRENEATEDQASVTGGFRNTASGNSSTVSGGTDNSASAIYSTVSGGGNNQSNGVRSTVSGGSNRTAAGDTDWVAGSLFQDT